MESLLDLAGASAYVLVGLLAAAESGLFVGLLVPGETAMILAGVLAAQGRAEVGWLFLAACLGAVIGDAISFEIGRRYGARLTHTRLGRRVGDARWCRARDYVQTRGGRAVFFGRFVGVLRALVPAVAGWAGMPIRSFLIFNIAGGALWAGGCIMAGVAAGRSWRVVERWVGLGSLAVAAAVIALLAGVLIAKSRADRKSRAPPAATSEENPGPPRAGTPDVNRPPPAGGYLTFRREPLGAGRRRPGRVPLVSGGERPLG